MSIPYDIKPTSHYLGLLNQVHMNNDLASLSEIDTEAAVAFGYMNTLYGELEAKKAKFEEEMISESGKKTNTVLERAWFVTEDGQNMIRLKRDIKTMDTILKSVKNKLITLSIEKKENG